MNQPQSSMIVCTASRSRLLPKRRLFSQRFVAIRHASANASLSKTPYQEPLPSQLLRFALTGTSQPSQSHTSGSDLDHHLQELFHGEWPLNIPPPSWSLLQPEVTARNAETLLKGLRHDVQNVQQLQTLIERNVTGAETGAVLQRSDCTPFSQALERCQRYNSCTDILSAINGIIRRLEAFDVSVPGNFHVLGMQYACLSHSAPSFKRHLEGYCGVGRKRLDRHLSISLVNPLIYFIETVQFDHPRCDVSCILSLVAGEGSSILPFQYKLHDILCWTEPENSTDSIGQYALLLTKLRSRGTLQKVWDQFLHSLSTQSPRHAFHSAYACVLALVDAGESERAVNCLKQLSKRADNTLPGISTYQRLGALLVDEAVNETLTSLAGQRELLGILESQLEVIERRLGIEWQPDKSHYSSISDTHCIASGRALFNMDGDSHGFDSKDRLIAEIRAIGCSKSLVDLGTIANLLDEHEGSEILVSLPVSRDTPFEFSWVPQRSPIEFSGTRFPASTRTDMSIPWSPHSLGLIRARLVTDGSALTSERSLHLMQLGYLAMRPAPQSDKEKHGKQHTWQPSGHIVALDRASGQFLTVWVGKDHEFLEPGIQPCFLPFQGGPGTVANLALPGGSSGDLALGNRPFPFGNPSARLHLEVDPSLDLNF